VTPSDAGTRPRIALPQEESAAAPTWQDELEALRVCFEALTPLDVERQQRIVAAVLCLLDGDSAVQVLRAWNEKRKRAGG